MENISIHAKNGYTYEKVMLAKQYLDEIGQNKRNFPYERLVEMYNEIYNRNAKADGCKCQSPRYLNGIQNFYKFGKITLIANGLATEEDFEKTNEERLQEVIENKENRIKGVEEEIQQLELDFDVQEMADEISEEQPKRKAGRPKKTDK